MRYLALLSLAVGCGPFSYPRPEVVSCTSPCNTILTGDSNCVRYVEHETETLAAFEKLVGWPAQDVCASLDRWWVRVLDTDGRGWWRDDFGRDVTGLVHYWASVMELGSGNWGLNAYTHEVAHVYEEYIGDFDENNPHANWEEKGIYEAIWETRYVEKSILSEESKE